MRTGIEGSDDEALDTGQDEELSRWEQEQIRKGISIPQVGMIIMGLITGEMINGGKKSHSHCTISNFNHHENRV